MVAVLAEYGPGAARQLGRGLGQKRPPQDPRRVADALLAAGFTADDVDLVLVAHPVAFYGLSGRLNLDVTTPDVTHEGNSVLRGGE